MLIISDEFIYFSVSYLSSTAKICSSTYIKMQFHKRNTDQARFKNKHIYQFKNDYIYLSTLSQLTHFEIFRKTIALNKHISIWGISEELWY